MSPKVSQLASTCVLTTLMLCVCTPVYAFQETKIPTMADSPKESNKKLLPSPDNNLNLNLPKSNDSSNDNKSQIYIPGLGKFKGLPKFNFGLELLYSDEKEEPAIRQDGDDLTIKGTLKHKF